MPTHAFMVHVTELAGAETQRRVNFVADAYAVRKQMLDSNEAYDSDEVHAYIQARLVGKEVAKPKARSWRG